MMHAGSSEPSLVSNSISTQISYDAHPWLLAGSKMYDCIVGNRKKNLYFIFILFDTSLSYFASIFCDSGRYKHADYVILSSNFFSRR